MYNVAHAELFFDNKTCISWRNRAIQQIQTQLLMYGVQVTANYGFSRSVFISEYALRIKWSLTVRMRHKFPVYGNMKAR